MAISLREYGRAYREANRERISAQRMVYRASNSASLAEKNKEYRNKNRGILKWKREVYVRANMDKILDYMRAYKRANPDRRAKWHRKAKYGMTTEQWETLFDNQGRKCAICGNESPKNKRPWHIDHCHETGNVRGILCCKCNTGLGMFCDKIGILEKAICYIKRGLQ